MRLLFLFCLLAGCVCCFGCAVDSTRVQNVKPAEGEDALQQLKGQIDKLILQIPSREIGVRSIALGDLRILLEQSGKKQKELLQYLHRRALQADNLEIRAALEAMVDPYLNPWKYFTKIHALAHVEDPFRDASIDSVAFSPDGKLLAATGFDKICMWDTSSGECIKTLESNATLNSLAFSPDGKMLAAANTDNTVQIWSGDGEKCLRTIEVFEGHAMFSSEVKLVAFSPDSSLLAVVGNKPQVVYIVKPHTGELLRKVEGVTEPIAWSPDGKILASCENEVHIRMWNVNTGECVRRIKLDDVDAVYSTAFSPDGRLLTSAGVFGVHVWDAKTGQYLRMLSQHENDDVDSLVFSPDGKWLACATGGKSIRIWNAHTGECLRVIAVSDNTMCIDISYNGRMIACGMDYHKVVILGIPEY